MPDGQFAADNAAALWNHCYLLIPASSNAGSVPMHDIERGVSVY